MNESTEILYIKKLEFICIELLSSLDELAKYNKLKASQVINHITFQVKQNNFFTVNKKGYEILKNIIFPLNSNGNGKSLGLNTKISSSESQLKSQDKGSSYNGKGVKGSNVLSKDAKDSKEVRRMISLTGKVCKNPMNPINEMKEMKEVKELKAAKEAKDSSRMTFSKVSSSSETINLNKTKSSCSNLKIKNIDLSVYININNNYSRNKKDCLNNKKSVIKKGFKSGIDNISITDIKNILDEKSKSYLHFSYDEFFKEKENKRNDSSILGFDI